MDIQLNETEQDKYMSILNESSAPVSGLNISEEEMQNGQVIFEKCDPFRDDVNYNLQHIVYDTDRDTEDRAIAASLIANSYYVRDEEASRGLAYEDFRQTYPYQELEEFVHNKDEHEYVFSYSQLDTPQEMEYAVHDRSFNVADYTIDIETAMHDKEKYMQDIEAGRNIYIETPIYEDAQKEQLFGRTICDTEMISRDITDKKLRDLNLTTGIIADAQIAAGETGIDQIAIGSYYYNQLDELSAPEIYLVSRTEYEFNELSKEDWNKVLADRDYALSNISFHIGTGDKSVQERFIGSLTQMVNDDKRTVEERGIAAAVLETAVKGIDKENGTSFINININEALANKDIGMDRVLSSGEYKIELKTYEFDGNRRNDIELDSEKLHVNLTPDRDGIGSALSVLNQAAASLNKEFNAEALYEDKKIEMYQQRELAAYESQEAFDKYIEKDSEISIGMRGSQNDNIEFLKALTNIAKDVNRADDDRQLAASIVENSSIVLREAYEGFYDKTSTDLVIDIDKAYANDRLIDRTEEKSLYVPIIGENPVDGMTWVIAHETFSLDKTKEFEKDVKELDKADIANDMVVMFDRSKTGISDPVLSLNDGREFAVCIEKLDDKTAQITCSKEINEELMKELGHCFDEKQLSDAGSFKIDFSQKGLDRALEQAFDIAYEKEHQKEPEKDKDIDR